MSLCNVDSKLYLFGGSGPSASCFNDLQIFDPSKFQVVSLFKYLHEGTVSWTLTDTVKLDEQPIRARAGHTMTLFEGKLYIMGGSYGRAYFKDFYIIDTG